MFSTVSLQKRQILTQFRHCCRRSLLFAPVAQPKSRRQSKSVPEARIRSGIDDELCKSNPFTAQLLERLHDAESASRIRPVPGVRILSRRRESAVQRTFQSCCLRFSLLALSVLPSTFINGRTSSPTSFRCRTTALRCLGSKLLPRGFARHKAEGVVAKYSTATW